MSWGADKERADGGERAAASVRTGAPLGFDWRAYIEANFRQRGR